MNTSRIFILVALCASFAVHAAEQSRNDQKSKFDLMTRKGQEAYVADRWQSNRSVALFAMKLWDLPHPGLKKVEKHFGGEANIPSDLQEFSDFGLISYDGS